MVDVHQCPEYTKFAHSVRNVRSFSGPVCAFYSRKLAQHTCKCFKHFENCTRFLSHEIMFKTLPFSHTVWFRVSHMHNGQKLGWYFHENVLYRSVLVEEVIPSTHSQIQWILSYLSIIFQLKNVTRLFSSLTFLSEALKINCSGDMLTPHEHYVNEEQEMAPRIRCDRSEIYCILFRSEQSACALFNKLSIHLLFLCNRTIRKEMEEIKLTTTTTLATKRSSIIQLKLTLEQTSCINKRRGQHISFEIKLSETLTKDLKIKSWWHDVAR